MKTFKDYLKEEQLNELSPSTLASYKKKAAADSSEKDTESYKSFKAGDVKKGQAQQDVANKRFRGIIKATKKEFKQKG